MPVRRTVTESPGGMSQSSEIHDAGDRSRFETEVEGHTATLDYRIEGATIRLVHTEVPPALESRGIGSSLVRHALESARSRGLEVWPQCPFVAAYIRQHPEYLDLVPASFPGRDRLESESGSW